MRIALMLATAAAGLATACASTPSTPYQAASAKNPRGYKEQQVENNRMRLGDGEFEQSGPSYQAIADVTTFKGAKPTLIPNAYGAREVKANPEFSVQRPVAS